MEGETSHDRCCESWVRQITGSHYQSGRVWYCLQRERCHNRRFPIHQKRMRFLEVCQRWRDRLNINRGNRTDLGRKEHRGYYDGFLEDTHDQIYAIGSYSFQNHADQTLLQNQQTEARANQIVFKLLACTCQYEQRKSQYCQNHELDDSCSYPLHRIRNCCNM